MRNTQDGLCMSTDGVLTRQREASLGIGRTTLRVTLSAQAQQCDLMRWHAYAKLGPPPPRMQQRPQSMLKVSHSPRFGLSHRPPLPR